MTLGSYTFKGSGGAQVGPFSASVDYPQLEWTNIESLQEIDRSQPLTLTWQNGPPGALVRIRGGSTFTRVNNVPLGLSFMCWADAAAGSFTVPPDIVASLPPSIETPDFASGFLSLILTSFGGRFAATGLDMVRIEPSDSISKPVKFR